ncbi:MAG: GxxExxY protein, partial [Desulfatiglandaceae bacterium]
MEYPEKDLTEKIIGAAIEVHKYWGPGLIESVYETSLVRELELQGIEHRRQVDLKLEYKGAEVGDGLRLDLIVEGKVIVELKVVKNFDPIHEAQLLTY